MTAKELLRELKKTENRKHVVLKVGCNYTNEFRIEEGTDCVWVKEVE